MNKKEFYFYPADAWLDTKDQVYIDWQLSYATSFAEHMRRGWRVVDAEYLTASCCAMVILSK